VSTLPTGAALFIDMKQSLNITIRNWYIVISKVILYKVNTICLVFQIFQCFVLFNFNKIYKFFHTILNHISTRIEGNPFVEFVQYKY